MPATISVGLSELPGTLAAAAEAADAAAAGLGEQVDLCVVFAGPPHLTDLEEAVALIAERLRPRAMIGCGAAGVLATNREIEAGPGLVVWAAELPGATVSTFEAEPGIEGAGDPFLGLPARGSDADAVLLLADPFGFPTPELLEHFNEEWAGTPVLGGLASAAGPNGSGVLILDGELRSGVAVGCLLDGVDLTPCVSQGATPLGPEMTITAAEGNVISELASQPALGRLGEVLAGLDSEQRLLARSGMLIGITIDENRPEHERGDFLVRPIVGADRESGAIAVGEEVRVGQTVRMHLRDGDSADADLREALAIQAGAMGSGGSAGALMFTCNGRGRGMFGTADHDVDAVEEALGAPVAGFFCAGEVGPVGGSNFLHGFTATLAVFAAE